MNKKLPFIITDEIYRVIDVVPSSIYWKDKDGFYLGCNKFMLEMAGLKEHDEIIGKSDYQLPWKSIADELRRIDISVETSGRYEGEETPVLAANEKRSFFTIKVPLFDDSQTIQGIIGVSMDITAQKNAERREKAAMEEIVANLKSQVNLFKQLAATVAHELSTPLKGIQMGTEFVREDMPILESGYRLAVKNGLVAEDIPEKELADLHEALSLVLQEIDAAFLFIEMLLANIQAEKFVGELHRKHRIQDTIQAALNRYPLSEDQRLLIHTTISQNFAYNGSENLLIHVLFNLLKNALYYVAKAGKGEIWILAEEEADYNVLHFKDTGLGISPDVLPHIFEHFFSRTLHGAGVGLAYCKMVMTSFGGEIECETVAGEFTEFILKFPKV